MDYIPTIKKYPLERKKIIKKFISGMAGYSILFLVIAGVTFIFNVLSSGVILSVIEAILFLGFTIFYFWYQTKYYDTYYYDIREEFLVIKKGVFMPRETTLPYEKLQDVYLDQDIWDKIFGLWDLHVSTATYLSGSEAHIDGVNINNGEIMKKMILDKVKESKKK